MFELTGRKALVTGASGGIGEAIARVLHAQGAIVGLHGTRIEKLETLAGELGDRVKLFPANLSNRDEVKALGQKAETELEGVDIQLNKAGIITAEQTFKLKKRDIVSVAGSVIVRQRPSTAKDVVFMTMEDETGYSNFLILPDVFDKFRSVIVGSNFLVVRGIHEERGMIKALFFQPINAFISKIASHDFQ